MEEEDEPAPAVDLGVEAACCSRCCILPAFLLNLISKTGLFFVRRNESPIFLLLAQIGAENF